MKKILALLIVCVFVISFTACNEATVSSGNFDFKDMVLEQKSYYTEEKDFYLSKFSKLYNVAEYFEGFTPLQSGTDKISADEIQKIYDCFINEFEEGEKPTYEQIKLTFIKAYGDAYYVHLRADGAEKIGVTTFSIDDFELYNCPLDSCYYIYKNGQLMTVNKAIDEGVITEQQKKDIIYGFLPKKDSMNLENKYPNAVSLNDLLKDKELLPDASRTLTDEQRELLISKAILNNYYEKYTKEDIHIELYKSYENAFLVYAGPKDVENLYVPNTVTKVSYYEEGEKQENKEYAVNIKSVDYYHCYFLTSDNNVVYIEEVFNNTTRDIAEDVFKFLMIK